MMPANRVGTRRPGDSTPGGQYGEVASASPLDSGEILLPNVEPPSADPHARWCGRGPGAIRAPIPILRRNQPPSTYSGGQSRSWWNLVTSGSEAIQRPFRLTNEPLYEYSSGASCPMSAEYRRFGRSRTNAPKEYLPSARSSKGSPASLSGSGEPMNASGRDRISSRTARLA